MSGYGLVGERLGHSHSPAIHAMLGNAEYGLFEVPREKIDAFFDAREFRGLNVTMPYKVTALSHCDELTDAARVSGNVNTLTVRPDGTMLGDNTDYAGFVHMLRYAGIELAGRKVAVLGSGGASRTVRSAAEGLGARDVVTVSRTGSVSYENLSSCMDAQVVINATPVGMFPENGKSPVRTTDFSKLEAVVDLVYNPLKTALVLEAEARGVKACGGLMMLVAQAKYAEERFFGRELDDSLITPVYVSLLRKLTNLVLIGMPGSGKTAVGRLAADLMRREFADIDELVVQRSGKSIESIFAEDGEDCFRALEAEETAKAGAVGGRVIAVGGGNVLSAENVAALRQNGVMIEIGRDIGKLALSGRPLSKDMAALERLYAERRDIYAACRDALADNNGELELAAKKATEAFDEITAY